MGIRAYIRSSNSLIAHENLIGHIDTQILIGDIEEFELVQKRALKIPEGFGDLDYRDRLHKLKLTSLKNRRTKGDLKEMFKVQKGFEKIAWIKSPPSIEHKGATAGVRGNALRLHKESLKARLSNDFSQSVTARHNFFLNRVVPLWNSLPDDVVSYLTVNSFKNALDRHFKRFGCYILNMVGFHL